MTANRVLTALLTASLLVAACGDDDDTAATDDTSTSETTEANGTTETSETSDTTGTTRTPPPGGLPGERVDIYPYEGAALGVVGVEADDTLNVRRGPGVDFDVVAELDPLDTGLVATGHNRSIDNRSFWVEVEVDGRTGWANVSFLSHLGRTDDITSQIAPSPGELPRAETMLQLGKEIAHDAAADAPRPRIVVVDGPTVGDLGEITVDVLGLADDALGGVRLHVFATPDDSGESFTLKTVEQTVLCTRGVAEEGACV